MPPIAPRDPFQISRLLRSAIAATLAAVAILAAAAVWLAWLAARLATHR